MKLKRIIVLYSILFIASLPLFAQRGGNLPGGSSSSSKPTLTVNCNVRNARVEIGASYYKDGFLASGTAPFSVQLDSGTYTVTVSAPGYEQKQELVKLSSSTSIMINLGQSSASLQINSNVRDARVVIRGGGINGQLAGSAPFTAQLQQGRYNITVSAPGYQTVSQDINLGGSQSITINLAQESYQLTVTSNVAGAKVFIRGGGINGQLTGTTNMTTTLPPGRYQIKVNAPHFFAEEQTIDFFGTATVNIQLKPRTGRLDIIIPNNILDYSQSNPANRISIYDNGTRINGTSLQLTPGQHTIRITSGGLASQQTINVQEGESYRIELNFEFSLIRQ